MTFMSLNPINIFPKHLTHLPFPSVVEISKGPLQCQSFCPYSKGIHWANKNPISHSANPAPFLPLYRCSLFFFLEANLYLKICFPENAICDTGLTLFFSSQLKCYFLCITSLFVPSHADVCPCPQKSSHMVCSIFSVYSSYHTYLLSSKACRK